MKHKSTRISSFLLAVVLVFTLVLGTGMQAFADEPESTPNLGTTITAENGEAQKEDETKKDETVQKDDSLKKDETTQPDGGVIPPDGSTVQPDEDTTQQGAATLPDDNIIQQNDDTLTADDNTQQNANQANGGIVAGNAVPPPPEADGKAGDGIAAAPIATRGYHFEPSTLPAGTKGVAYSQTISLYNEYNTFSGIKNEKKQVHKWEASGTLPKGMTFSGGVFSGTPTQAGEFTYTVTATYVNVAFPFTHTATQVYTIIINEGPTITTTTLANGIKGVAYTGATLAATGTASITWSATGLPAGLTLSAAGVLSGTPTVSGTFTVAVAATNAAGTAKKNLTLTIYEKPAITTASLLNGSRGARYSQTLKASGTTPITWRVANGSLPAGLTLSTVGAITGTPTTAGKFTFTVEAENTLLNYKYIDTKEYTIEIWQAPSITTKSPPFGVVGKEYNYQLAATGYPQNFKWELTMKSSLPKGLTLNKDTGLISGTPTEIGTTQFGIKVTNSKGTDSYILYSITVYPMPKIKTGSLSNSAVGTLYSDAVQVEPASVLAGAPIWSLAESSALPAGLSLNKNTGIIYGRPAEGTAGEYTVTVVVTNKAGSDSKTYTFSVYEGPAITTQTIEPCVIGTAYSQTLQATGHPAAVWSVVGGVLPDGLTLNADGTITGTPAEGAEGEYNITVKAESTYNYTYIIDLNSKIFHKAATESDTKTYSLSVYLTPSIVESDLDDAILGEEYNATLETSAYPEATWSLYEMQSRRLTTSFTGLPAGLTLNTDGTITGVAEGPAGTYNFSVVANNAGGTSQPVAFSITVNDKPVITTMALANGLVGSEYGALVLEGTSSTPITWSIEGELPAGISLTDGTFGGTPTKGGTYQFTVVATNITGSNYSAKIPFTMVVNEKPTIITEFMYNELVGLAYNFTLEATGDADITWALADGSKLPAGLTLSSDGKVTGKLTTVGDYTFSIVATNAFGSFTKEFTVFVNPVPDPIVWPGKENPPVNGAPAAANPAAQTTAVSPKTGDSSNIFMVLSLLVLSATAVFVSTFILKKRSQNK